jgi:hypothetical protein
MTRGHLFDATLPLVTLLNKYTQCLCQAREIASDFSIQPNLNISKVCQVNLK